jgi:signal transduction histidine kinase
MLWRVERVLRLGGKHYLTSLAVWLISAPSMIGGLLFTELRGPWSVPDAVGVLLAGTAGHLAIGAVFLVCRYLVFPWVENERLFAWWVGGGLIVAGTLRGLTIGGVAQATGVGELVLTLRVPTGIALVLVSFPLVAFSLQLWADYRHKRYELLLSLLVYSPSAEDEIGTAGAGDYTAEGEVVLGIEAAREQTLAHLASIRRAIMSEEFSVGSAQGILDSTDSAWRETSHEVWKKGLPHIPRITPTELLRTWSASKPFLLIALAIGPLYGFSRTLEGAPLPERWAVFGLWVVGAVALGAATNAAAARAAAFGPAVLLVAAAGIQALPVSLGFLIVADPTLLLQLWFVGFVSSTISLIFGFPLALERQGQRVIDELEKWVDQATLEAVRAQGENFMASKRVAHYLHSELRGHFLRLSISLRHAIDNRNQVDALRILDDLDSLVTELSSHATSAPPQENLTEFLANWGRMIRLTHNLDTVILPPFVAMATEAIAMEAVNDAVRHAQASTVDVTVTQHGDEYHLVITSDGHAPPSAFSPGLGTRILNTYAPGRWSRIARAQKEQQLSVHLSAVFSQSGSS